MKLYFIRHTSVNVPKTVCYGQTNVPLTDTFEEEAEIVKNNLSGIHFDAILSSPLSRCRKLAKYCGYDNPKLHDRLKEINFGDWEMQEWNKIDGIDKWFDDWMNTPAKNGESFRDVYNRFVSFINDLKKTDYKNVAIFTHGGIMCCAKIYFENADPKKIMESVPKYGALLEFEI